MYHEKRWICLLLTAVLMLSCMSSAFAASENPSDHSALRPGDTIHGFTVTEVYDSSLLNSVIYTFDHDVSGATLVYVENDDPEAAFSIGYHTPYVDETDTNHVFEHSILAGSEKYPAKDLFFDILNRGYQTYVNAHTSLTTTWYPISSLSEDQLLKMADAYMSCMVAPSVLEDENIFKREAVRFELEEPDGEITINGTVFAEDSGFLTNKADNALNHLLDALYPGKTASNMLGMAHWHYDDLTWEHTVETFERCYHFDNSLIFLYGDLDLDRFLAFLDEEYLSRYPAQGTDLSAWEDGPAEPGFVDVEMSIPAYEGDTAEHNSIIRYAIDLDGATNTELHQYQILTTLLNQLGSPLYNLQLERGIENEVSAGVIMETAKPMLLFSMDYADPSQKADLKSLAEDALAQVAAEGINPAILETVIKSQERSAKLLRNSTNVGVDLVGEFLTQWAYSGDPNPYRTYELALKALQEDSQQQILRSLAQSLLQPRRSALVTSVPTPGLAEQHDQALADYLKDMKASMTPAEIDAMVAETDAFNIWNAEEIPNNGFLISPADLPDPVMPAWSKQVLDDVTVYQGSTELAGVGQYAICFDLSGMSREEMEYLMLSSIYRMQMDTTEHTAAEFYLLFQEYISDLNASLLYPSEAAGENHRPMLCVTWTSLTEDFDQSLDLILELFTKTDYSDPNVLAYLTAVYADSWDMSRQSPDSTAYYYSHDTVGLNADSNRFEMDVDGQGCYDLISSAARKLSNEAGFAEELAATYADVTKKAFTRDNLIFMSVAADAENGAIVTSALEALNSLPEKENADAEYTLPEADKSLAVCVESSMNSSYLVGDYMDDTDFTGNYLPFWYALSDLYTVPTFRFRLGAYSAYSAHQWGQGCLYTLVYSDPNVRATVDALADIPEALNSLELTEESLDGYILSAYSTATMPQGVLNETMTAMQQDLLGIDADRTLSIKKQIKEATLADQTEAAEHIAAVFSDADYCMAGNEELIRNDADCFEEIVSWRQGASFTYEHDPRENPTAMRDIVENPDAVYGFSPSSAEDSTLKEYADAIDWTDPEQVAAAREQRQAYHDSMEELYDIISDMIAENQDIETIARAVSQRRNELRLEAYNEDPEGLKTVKERNLETYGNEMGPTPESLYEKYGSWDMVLIKALSANPGMDACLGFYDDYYYLYDFEED